MKKRFTTLLLIMIFFNGGTLCAQITFEEQWRLDPDTDDIPVWMGSKLTIDSSQNGNLFLADFPENRILVFNKKGHFIKQIGRSGDGPGEFRRLSGFDILSDGSVMIFEDYGFDRAWAKLNADGKEIASGWMKQEPHPFGALRYRRDGAFLIAQVWNVFGRAKAKEKFGAEALNATETCLSIMDSESLQIKIEKSCVSSVRKERYKPGENNILLYKEDALRSFKRNLSSSIAQWSEGLHLYSAHPDKYLIQKYDSKLQLMSTYRRKSAPILYRTKHHVDQYYQAVMEIPSLAAVSDKLDVSFVQDIVQEAQLPIKLPPVLGLLPVNDSLLVLRGYDTEKDRVIADFWDGEGTFKGEVRLPKMFVNLTGNGLAHKRKTIFRNGYAFIMEPKGTEYVLVCYRYTLE